MGAAPVGVAVEVEDDGAVQEPVEHRGGDGGVAEDLAPGTVGPVRGEHDRGLQIALADDLAPRVRAAFQVPRLSPMRY